MSDRKQRQWNRLSPDEQVLTEVRAIAGRPFVSSVADHFAGYFDELGITVNLVDGTPDSDVVQLRNELLQYLERASKERRLEFTWQVAFWRGATQVALLFPGDRPLDPKVLLEPVH
jgi:hypothetical protein